MQKCNWRTILGGKKWTKMFFVHETAFKKSYFIKFNSLNSLYKIINTILEDIIKI